MTDCGEYTDEDYAEIWEEMSRAERYADKMEAGLDALNDQLDALLEATKRAQTETHAASEDTPHDT